MWLIACLTIQSSDKGKKEKKNATFVFCTAQLWENVVLTLGHEAFMSFLTLYVSVSYSVSAPCCKNFFRFNIVNIGGGAHCCYSTSALLPLFLRWCWQQEALTSQTLKNEWIKSPSKCARIIMKMPPRLLRDPPQQRRQDHLIYLSDEKKSHLVKKLFSSFVALLCCCQRWWNWELILNLALVLRVSVLAH